MSSSSTYLECHNRAKNQHKYWQITIKGTSTRAHFGRVGTVGVEQVKRFSTKDEAEDYANDMLKQKLRGGYRVAQPPAGGHGASSGGNDNDDGDDGDGDKDDDDGADDEADDDDDEDRRPAGKTAAAKSRRSNNNKRSAASANVADEDDENQDNEDEDGNPSTRALAGMTFCLTGAMSVTRKVMTKLIQRHGGRVANTVTGAVTHLISAVEGTSKHDRALLRDDVAIESEEFIHDLISKAIKKAKQQASASTSKASTSAAAKSSKAQPAAADADEDDGGREHCSFGAQCYRKNAAHRKQYFHPGESKTSSAAAAAPVAPVAPLTSTAAAAPTPMVVDAPAAAAAAAADDGTDVEDDATDADDSDAGHSSGSDAFVSESLQLDNWDDDTASSSTAAALSSSSAAPAAAAAAAAPADEPTDDRPQCQYGAACYRRNAKHNAQFSHPKLLTASPAKPPAQASASSGKRAHSEDEADGGADTKPDAASATAATTAAAAGAGARKRLKMDQFSDDDIDDAAAGQASKVVETTESLERQAPRDMQEGDSIEIAGAGARNYFLKLIGGVYSCTCPAWRNQSKAINARTCKHVIAMRGQEAEDARLAEAEQAGGDADDDDGGDARSGKRRATSRPSKPPTSSYTVAPDLLLAHKWSPDLAVDFKGWFISEKWDGVRAYWDGSKFVSRLGNTFHAPKWFTQGLPTDCTLDGELWCGRNKFQQTVSIVRRSDMSSDWQRVKYLVFDIPSLKKPFEKRIEHLTQVVLPAANGSTYLEIVDHVPCKGDDHIKKELQRVEALGGEGLMLRKPGSMYEGRRSMTLLKVKSFEDADAKVIGHNQGSGRHQGRLGALVCILADGTQFNCGSGLSDQQRNKPPPIGSVVIVRYQELTAGKVPRFPVFVGVRADAVWPPQA